MSMYPDSEKFDQLKRLLVLKRYEQPPPGYFNSFSRQVCARIKAGERASDPGIFGLLSNSYWLQRIWASFERQPVMAGALGMAACVVLLAGILYTTETSDIPQQVYLPGPTVTSGSVRPSQDSVFERPTLATFQLNNGFQDVALQGSLLPVQPALFTVQGN